MDDRIYWIWLQLALGAGFRAATVLERWKSPKNLYQADSFERRLSGCLNTWQLRRMQETKLEDAQKVLDTCRSNGWQILTPEQEAYPERLKSLDDFPLALYLWGTLPEIDAEVCISMVGTRKASCYGIEVAARLATGLAKAGAIVVSGGALGIDTAAHQGALALGGYTIAVLGCGFGTDYLMKNESLRKAIAATGCVLTEFPPFTQASKYTFPVRNRLISGLSLGTVVVEAAVKSGALITARFAQAQGRDVFAVAGSVIDPANEGTNRLIHDGAKPVFCVMDILEEYTSRFCEKLRLEDAGQPLSDAAPANGQINFWNVEDSAAHKTNTAQNIIKKGFGGKSEKKTVLPVRLPETLSQQAQQVWHAMESETHVDTLASLTGLAPRQVLSALTELEMNGLAVPASGRRYRRCQN